jgi:hypothetical protein
MPLGGEHLQRFEHAGTMLCARGPEKVEHLPADVGVGLGKVGAETV